MDIPEQTDTELIVAELKATTEVLRDLGEVLEELNATAQCIVERIQLCEDTVAANDYFNNELFQ